MDLIKENAKAVAALVICAAAYLTGILGDTEGLSDVSFKEWLGLAIFMGGAYGITYGIKNKGTVQVKDLNKLDQGLGKENTP